VQITLVRVRNHRQLTPRGCSGAAAEEGYSNAGSHRYEQDIVTVIKDILCAVAVMVIHIENRNPLSAIVCKACAAMAALLR
jgi:hypothetical protein